MKSLPSLKFEWLSFLAALGLMSRLPISFGKNYSDISREHRARAAIWYPAVGLILGIFLFGFSSVFPNEWPQLVEAVLLLIIWIAFTGALHLDGIADTADAWVGGMGDRQRTLDIMKDPSCGPMAVVVLVLTLLLKFVLITSLLQSSFPIILLVIPMLARAWLLPMLFSMPYARQQKFDPHSVQISEVAEEQGGMASDLARDIASGLSIRAAQISFATAQLLALLALFFTGLGLGYWFVGLVFCLLLFVLLRRAFLLRVGGYSGDLLGATIELQELVLLMACIFFI